jgi:hypothetical protein
MNSALNCGRVSLHEWEEPLLVDHVVSLLLDLREARGEGGARPIVVLVIRATAFEKGGVPEVLQTALPAVLDCCAELIVVARRADARSSALRPILQPSTSTQAGRKSPRHCESIDQALAYVQNIAPHDVLELRRQSLRRSRPPSGGER